MSIALSQIPLRTGESENLEWKRDAADLNGIGAALCAFLNGQGGRILVGFDENGQIRAVEDAAGRARAIEAFLRAHIVPASLWSLSVQSTPDGEWIEIAVPAGADKPYLFRDQIYSRTESQTSKATAEQVRALIAKGARQPTRWERQLAPDLEPGDLDHDEIQKTAQSRIGLAGVWRNSDAEMLETLSSLSLYSYGSFTNAARVLFERNPALRLPQTRVRLTRFATGKGDTFLDDRMVEGHAFDLIETILLFLKDHIATEVHFEAGDPVQQRKPDYPFAALREGIVNALVHRDYAPFQSGMSVGIYPDRIEIWNSGRLPDALKVKDLKQPHPSLPFNPDIAHVFYRRGYMERVGQGTSRIVAECRSLGSPEPNWKQAEAGITLTFWRRTATAGTSLNSRQQELLARLKTGESLDINTYAPTQTVSRRQVRRDLAELVEAGWLRREGNGPATVYVRTKP